MVIHVKHPSQVYTISKFEEHTSASIQGAVEVLTGSRTEQSPVALHYGSASGLTHSVQCSTSYGFPYGSII